MAFIDQFGLYLCNTCTRRICRLALNHAEYGLSLKDEAEAQGFEFYDGPVEWCDCGFKR